MKPFSAFLALCEGKSQDIFRLNAQTDYYNGHPRYFADELPDYLGWIQLGPVSTYGVNEAFPWKILTEMIYHLIHVKKFWD